MSKRQNKTSIGEIVDYWAERIDESDLSVDWSEAEELCWNCGSPKELTRCHIVPDALGGSDEPANYVVLCRSCHEQAPNVLDPRIMWDWLFAHKADFYQTYWLIEGMREYEFMYKRSIDDELSFIVDNAKVEVSIDEASNELMREAVFGSVKHFGQSTPNPSTVAGIMRIFLLRLAESKGLELPNARPGHLTDQDYLS